MVCQEVLTYGFVNGEIPTIQPFFIDKKIEFS